MSPSPILQPGRNCWSIDPADGCGVLVDCRAYYLAFYRALVAAQRTVWILGWQFDSTVDLVRGEDALALSTPTRFLDLLNRLCALRPALEVRILAWDFSVVYAFEREWFQSLVFDWKTHDRVHFRTDRRHPIGASHHQKVALVDGALGFLGGADVCAHRWDDRDHRIDNPDRHDGGEPYGPNHEVQAYVRGPVAARLVELFRERWRDAGYGELDAPVVDGSSVRDLDLPPSIPIPARRAALVRTRPANVLPVTAPIEETRNLFADAIGAAEQIVYLETQYLSSIAVRDAFVERMRDRSRPPPEIVIVMPSRAWATIESLAVGAAQARLLRVLHEVATETGTPLGVYWTLGAGTANAVDPAVKDPVATYVHSKVLVVDDRLLVVASANATNRSMGLDTELGVAWEAEPDEAGGRLARAIRRARVSLLAEHAGVSGRAAVRRLATPRGLVEHLDRLAGQPDQRLRRMSWEEPPTVVADGGPLFDPERPLVEADLHEKILSSKDSLLARGLTALGRLLTGGQ